MKFENVELHNVQEMIQTEDGIGQWLSRVPDSFRQKLNPLAQDMALFGSGCEIRFCLEGESAKITLSRDEFPIYRGAGVAEVYFGSFSAAYVYGPVFIGTEPKEIEIKKPGNMNVMKELTDKHRLPFDPELVRIVLPYDTKNRLVSIEGNVSYPHKEQMPSFRYLAYGSSITQGASALTPSGTYAARTATILGADLINLGSAGSCFLEPEMADYIAARKDWDCATLELGINVLDITTEEFSKRVDYFVSKVAEANKDKWIFCTAMFSYITDDAGEMKAKEFRDVVRNKVRSLNLPKLVHMNGPELLSLKGLSFDLGHPSAAGMEEISGNVAAIMKNYLNEN